MSRRYARPPILAQLDGAAAAVLEASAGTGKTYALEHLVVELLLSGEVRLPEILVVTFTEKATHDLTRKLRARLVDLLDGEEAPAGHPSVWLLDEAARGRIARALSEFEAGTLCTIHAFCQRVLTEQAFFHRRLFDQARIDGHTAFHAAFLDELRRTFAVDPEHRPFLAAWLAGGAGIDRLESLLYDCHAARGPVGPRFDLAAFTEAMDGLALPIAAARRRPPPLARGRQAPAMQRRLGELSELFATWERSRDVPRLLAALDDGVCVEHLLEVLEPCPLVDALARLDAARVPLAAALAARFLPAVERRLAATKAGEGLYDFADMLALVDESLRGPDGEALIQALRAQFRYALIDEFQDTDEVQWRIFSRLFLDAGAGRGLYVIGDPKQAIYGFRGADVHTYLQARERIVAGGGGRVSLTASFRATPALIAAQNLILDQAAPAPFFTGAIRYDAPVTPGNPSLRLREDGGEAAPVVLFCPDGDGKLPLSEARRCVADAIVAELERVRAGRLILERGDEQRRLGGADVFILVRSGWEGREMGRRLTEAGIPHAFHKQEGLFSGAEARHVRDLLLAVADPHDRARRMRALATPFFALELAELLHADDLPGGHPVLQRLFAWHGLAQARDHARLFARIVDDSGVALRALFSDDDERAWENYLQLFERLAERAARRRPELETLAQELSAYLAGRARPSEEDADLERAGAADDAVQIMTMHKAKGLEAPLVFLYGGLGRARARDVQVVHDGGHRRVLVGKVREARLQALLATEAAEEDQRLLYVALTRASARLYLPLYDPERLTRNEGAYHALNRRLVEVAAARPPGFELRPVGVAAPVRAAAAAQASGAPFRPALPPERPHHPELDRLRERHRAPLVTSYSRMRHDEPQRAAAPDEAPPALAEAALPSSAATGILLHALLEEVPLASLDEPAPAAWVRRPEVAAVFERLFLRFAAPAAWRDEAARLVHRALTAPLELDGLRLPGIARAPRVAREVEFAYPFPEASHPTAPGLGRFTVERGLLRGYLDALFEHEGRVYLVDWKSDLLAGYEPLTLTRHVEEHYRLQAEVYGVALRRMLRPSGPDDHAARFGGILYLFLRGLDGDGRRGVHFERPDPATLDAWEAALAARGPLGGAG